MSGPYGRPVAKWPNLGFNTLGADSAEHAYRVLDSQGIDAVLLDLRLPGAGGIEALHHIKSLRPDAVIVVVTGYGTVQSAVQAMKNGAYDYVTKPFSLDELKLLLVETGIRKHHWVLARNGEAVSHRRESGAQHASCTDSGRERNGKGVGRAIDPFLGAAARQAIYSCGLRLLGADVDRERAVCHTKGAFTGAMLQKMVC